MVQRRPSRRTSSRIPPLAILHFWWMKAGKNNFTEPLIVGIIVAVLLGLRVLWNRRKAAAAHA